MQALEEVVALDERTGHQDLESDRQTLDNARRIAALSPEERAQLRARQAEAEEAGPSGEQANELQAQLDALPPEERARVEAAMREMAERLARMSPEERGEFEAAARDAAQRTQIEQLANQARDAAIAARRGQTPREQLIPQLQEAAARAAEGEAEDSPWAQVAAFLNAVVALLRGEPVPPVPAAYAARMAEIQSTSEVKWRAA